MRIGPARLPVLGLLLLHILCGPSFALEYDAITSAPPAAKETPPPAEVPFFGDQPDLGKDEPADATVPFFGKPVAVEEKPAAKRRRSGKLEIPADAAEKPAMKRRRSGKLEIPADAAERNDLSFLEGCWYFEKKEDYLDTPGSPSVGMTQDYYCFNKHGKGRIYVQLFKYNTRRSGPASARFDKNGGIVLENPEFKIGVANIDSAHKRTVRCNGREAGTKCFKHCPNCRHLSKDSIVRLSRTP